jgi:Domain of unknown function (DUF4166)
MRLDIERAFDDPPIFIGDNTYDSRFRQLLARDAWKALEPAIQRRFSKRLKGAEVAVYRGEILETRLSKTGWLLSQFCRLIGAPLPLFREGKVAAVVIVSEDEQTGGQRWTRIYHRRRNNPQVINSAKVFGGSTGLEEHVGGGIGMALRVDAAQDRLTFTSDHYFVGIGKARLGLPRWCSPGVTKVTHRDLGGGRFAFDLEVRHVWFGEVVHQHAVFRDE